MFVMVYLAQDILLLLQGARVLSQLHQALHVSLPAHRVGSGGELHACHAVMMNAPWSAAAAGQTTHSICRRSGMETRAPAPARAGKARRSNGVVSHLPSFSPTKAPAPIRHVA